MKKIKHAIRGLGAALLFAFSGTAMTAGAVNFNHVTITVDATDDSGSLQYAIDSDAPEAFGDRNSFEVVPGSTHTIYVRDAAGNVTSQVYSIPEQEDREEEPEPAGQDGAISAIRADATVSESRDPETDERRVNIDVNLANGASTSSGAAAEDGGGTLYDKEETDGTGDSGKTFYTVTTKEGEVFYLVVDQNRNDNNVYLLTQATVNDLQYLADQNDYNFTVAATGQNSQSLLNMLSGNSGQGEGTEPVQPGGEPAAEPSGMNSTLLLVVIAAAGGGAYYFYRTKKDRREKQMDEIDSANDLRDYEIGDEEAEEDVLKFDEEPEEQELPPDDDLKELMALNTEAAFGEEGENGSIFEPEADESAEPEDPADAGMRPYDYDEFGEQEE